MDFFASLAMTTLALDLICARSGDGPAPRPWRRARPTRHSHQGASDKRVRVVRLSIFVAPVETRIGESYRRDSSRWPAPRHRHESASAFRPAICDIDGFHPGQAVAATHLTGIAAVQRTIAIMTLTCEILRNSHLRKRSDFASEGKATGRHACATVRQPTFARRQREHPIHHIRRGGGRSRCVLPHSCRAGFRRQAGHDGASFQARLMASPMPVLSLAASRTMDMRRVAQQKNPAFAEMLRDAVVDG